MEGLAEDGLSHGLVVVVRPPPEHLRSSSSQPRPTWPSPRVLLASQIVFRSRRLRAYFVVLILLLLLPLLLLLLLPLLLLRLRVVSHCSFVVLECSKIMQNNVYAVKKD